MYEHVERPALDDFEEWEKLWERYFQRASLEREEFAHRYAESAIATMREAGSIPFERELDEDALRAESLHPEDFRPLGR